MRRLTLEREPRIGELADSARYPKCPWLIVAICPRTGRVTAWPFAYRTPSGYPASLTFPRGTLTFRSSLTIGDEPKAAPPAPRPRRLQVD